MSTRDSGFADLLIDSYAKLVGKPLVTGGRRGVDAAYWLYYEAPFGLLAHDTSADPIFVYANLTAQGLFGYGWDEFTTLPSRLSATGPAQDDRGVFMNSVRDHGFAENYRGQRVTKTGRPFWIEDATVWNLIGPDAEVTGQAALIPRWID